MDGKKFNLRLPEDLYHWVAAFADEQGRSANAQIVQILKEERTRQAAQQKASQVSQETSSVAQSAQAVD